MAEFTRTDVVRRTDYERAVAGDLRPDDDVHRYVGAWTVEECEEMDHAPDGTGE